MELLIAAWGAVLSTILGIMQFVKWSRDKPRASVEIINPLEVSRFDRMLLEVIVSNVSALPIVVREMEVTFHDRQHHRLTHGTARFYHGSGWDPSIIMIPHADDPNTRSAQTQIIHPGSETHHLLKPFREYNPEQHWLRVKVFLRNSKKEFVAWAAPVRNRGNE